ncbi:HNH endonuclease [Brachybacterium sp. DNPG3]
MDGLVRWWMAQASALTASAPGLEVLMETSPGALVDLMRLLESTRNSLDALATRVEVAFRAGQIDAQKAAGVPSERLGRGISEQVSLARGITPTAAGNEGALNRVLVESMPRIMGLLEAGEIKQWTAHKIAGEVICLEDQDRAAVDEELAGEIAGDTPWTAAGKARRLVQEKDPQAAIERLQRATAKRRVSLRAGSDGMAVLRAVVPLVEGVAVKHALDQEAKAKRAAGDERSMGQIASDTLVERTLGVASVDEVDVEVQLLMTDETLLRGGSEPGMVEGHPVPAPRAREIALGVRTRPAQAPRQEPARWASDDDRPEQDEQHERHEQRHEQDSSPPGPDIEACTACDEVDLVDAHRWVRRLYADPVTGELVDVDARRRDFSAHVRRFVVLRDQACRAPYCDAKIRDVDHVHRYADGGESTVDNAAGHCWHFNLVLEEDGWESRLDGPETETPGTLRITTPTGHEYTSRPPRLRRTRSSNRSDDSTEGGDGEVDAESA